MQTVNNNFTVEALVAKYRNFVDEHCPKSCESDGVHEFAMPYNDEAEEQLLATLYKRVAGENADQAILEALSKYVADFYIDALKETELAFLANHFSEVSESIFDCLYHNLRTTLDFSLEKPSKVAYDTLSTAKIGTGKTIFIANSGFGDIAMLFPGCTIKGYSSEKEICKNKVWALGQIRLFAAGIKSEIKQYSKDTENSQYMADIDIAIFGATENSSCIKAEMLFTFMPQNSELMLFMDKREAVDHSLANFTTKLAKDKQIYSIVSLKETEETQAGSTEKRICLYVNKAVNCSICIKNAVTGKETKISPDLLNPEILWPSYYLTQRPDKGIFLAEIVSFQSLEDSKFTGITKMFNLDTCDIEWSLSDKSKNIPVVVPRDMSEEYENTNLREAKLKLAGNAIFKDSLGWIRKIVQPCILLYGRKDKFVVGYIKDLPSEGIVAYSQLACLVPKEGIDVRYVAALLLTPEVRNQIISICEGEVDAQLFPLIMDKIIVPSHTDLERATFLSEANYKAIGSSKKKMEDRLNEKKAEYINEVRMRKHDMRPHLRQMASSERLMLHYLDNINDIEDLKKLLKKQISTSHNALQSLSELVEHLSNEERFGEPECVNLNDYFHNIEKNSEVNFTIKVSCEKALAQRKKEIEELKEKNKKENVPSMQDMDEKTITECSLDVYIAPVDLDRIVNNIIENARRHGGLSDGRKSDYYISIDVKIDYQRDMYQIDFSNNGKPLPKGMTKERYGLKGEKAGPNAGTGSGGYIVKSIVEHYGGDFDLFSTDGITTIRIYLPKYL
uniref:ATP-binding protein n=1 Tax=Segatella hominis TaxID=2518605 RepID=UPI00258B6F6B